MVRFQCIHCGGRIAVHERYMDRLACCPECGGLTHPLAKHLVKAGETPSAPGTASAEVNGANGAVTASTTVATASETPAEVRCDNCGTPIGKLQKAFEWESHPVCGPCHRLLNQEKAETTVEPRAITRVAQRGDEVAAFVVTPARAATAPADEPEATDATPDPTPVIVVARKRARSVDIVAGPRFLDRASEMAWAMRGKIFGACAVMVALYVIVMILRSLSGVIMWTLGIAAVIAVIYWIRRGYLRLQKRVDLRRGWNILRVISSMVRR